MTRTRQADGTDQVGWGRGWWGSGKYSQDQIGVLWDGAWEAPVHELLSIPCFCFFSSCALGLKGRGRGGVQRHCLLLAICVVTIGLLEWSSVIVNVSTHLVMSNVAFSPSFMVMMPSSHPIVHFLSARDLKGVVVARVGAIWPMLEAMQLVYL